MKTPVLFLVGPTAVGKSQIALELACRLRGEILSADSMQVYRGMDIGTAKPTPSERRRIPHHLIDLCDVSENFSVYDYRVRALDCLRDVCERQKFAIVSGGTGLYIRAVLAGLSGHPGADGSLRARLEEEARDHGLDRLYQRLRETDPESAAKIRCGDKRRIIRALEIFETSGIPPTVWFRKRQPLEALGYDPVVIGVTQPREGLYRRIEERVDQMFDAGFLEEVQTLSLRKLSKTAGQAVGYKELLELLRSNPAPESRDLDAARIKIKKNTRHLAKRQWTWFKKEKGIEWIERGDAEDIHSICGKIQKKIGPRITQIH